MLDWIGHFHPLVIHFPIGLLLTALVIDGYAQLRKKDKLRDGVAPMVLLGAIASVVAIGLGYLLREGGDYEGTLMRNHAWSGYIAAGLASISAWYYLKEHRHRFWSLFITCVGISLAAHWGASITHGSDYLSWGTEAKATKGYSSAALLAQLGADDLTDRQLDQLNIQVRSLFVNKCIKCHNDTKRKGGLSLESKDGFFAGGESGAIYLENDARQSEIIHRLRLARSHDDAMPPEGEALAEDDILVMERWIDEGAHWADTTLKFFREAPLALVLPDVPSSVEYSHPIDRFTDRYFEEQKMDWPETIDDRSFVRRVYLDITGTLPSYDEASTFITDANEGKRMKLIEDLLADKEAYALHWLSFWNDLLRNDYSGTGYITGGRKQITDWLYHSLLEEKPYDEMVSELVSPTPESEGFIKGIKWRGVVNASQRTELQAAQNISQSLLGVNLKCASCHNSFVNNLTLDQAYGFANIFADSTLEIYQCDKPTGRFTPTSFLYPELGQVEGDSISDRLASLVAVMVQPENGRLYRTIVNRFWAQLFGRGIVAPVDEMDKLPWSQDLLDWLAGNFIEQNYDFPELLKTIMTSRTYQLPAVAYESALAVRDESFQFKGPLPRRLRAEQSIDALSEILQPFYHSVEFQPDGDTLQPDWIWHPELEFDRVVIPQPGTRYFRRVFEIEHFKQLQRAELLVTADHSFELALDEEVICSSDDWKEVDYLDVTSRLNGGKQIFAAQAENEGTIANPAGLLLTLRLSYKDGSTTYLNSDRQWLTTDKEPQGNWKSLTFIDTSWSEPRRYGSFQRSYWGQPLAFSFDQREGLPFARASLVKLDPFMKTLGRPVRENVATTRDDEATLLQALVLTNGEFFNDQIALGAKNWLERSEGNPEKLADNLYQQLFSRTPSRKEARIVRNQLGEDPTKEQVADLIWAMVLLPEFQFI